MSHQTERRLLTILFADLSGFTSISQTLDPEDLREVIDICFETLNRVITRHGGTIHKYEGDLVIALFGLPVAHEDDPERAVKAALEMVAQMPAVNNVLGKKVKMTSEIDLHIGINIGIVFAGEIGSTDKKEYTVIGDAVNFASRLKDVAQRGEILVSERLFRLTRYLFEYGPLSRHSLKGFSEPVNVFKPIRTKSSPSPKRGIAGLTSTMIERDTEFALLTKRIEKLCAEKKSSVVYIFGEAGIGKSRLLSELKIHIDTKHLPLAVLEGRCLSYGDTLAYFPFLCILKELCRITDQDSSSACKTKISDTVYKFFPDNYKEVLPYVGFLFSLQLSPELDEKVKYLDPQNLKLQIFVAVKNLIKAASREQPMLLVIEDYHWIDSTSLELLEFILGSLMPVPLMLICLSRPDKETAGYLLSRHLKKQYGEDFQEVVLRPLSSDASGRLADNLLSMSMLLPDAKERILSKAEGNPFYLEEILRSLIDRGFLVFEDGAWKATTQLAVPDIPDTVQEVIATRLDKLEPELKDLLQKAAVIGRSFYIRVLESLTGVDNLMISLHLATLEEFEYIRPQTREPELEYVFKHPLLQEVIYHSLPKKKRGELHGQVAEIVVALYHHRLEEMGDILAYHYANSDNAEKAIEWLRKAGLRAKTRHANDEAIKYFKRIVSTVEETVADDKSETTLAAQLDAYENLGDIYRLQGLYPSAIQAYRNLYCNTDNTSIKASSAYKTANVYCDQGDYDNAVKELTDAEKLSPAGSILEVKCLDLRAFMLRMHGNLNQAEEIYQKSIKLLESLGDRHELAGSLNQLGIICHIRGDYKKAIEYNQQAMAIFEEIGDMQRQSRLIGNLGVTYAHLGEIDKALECHQKNLEIAERIGDKRAVGIANNNISRIYIHKRDYIRAQTHLEKVRKISEEIGDRVLLSAAIGNLAIIHRSTGDLEKAEENLLEAERVLNEVDNKELLVVTYQQLAEVQLAKKKNIEKTLEYVDKAIALANTIGSKSAIAECHQLYSIIYGTHRDFVKAEENIERAGKLFNEIGKVDTHETMLREYAQLLRSIGEIDRAETILRKPHNE